MTSESVKEGIVSPLPLGNEFRFLNENFLLGPHVYLYEFKSVDLNESATRLVKGVKDRFLAECFMFERLLVDENKKGFAVVFVDGGNGRVTKKTPMVAEMVRPHLVGTLGKYKNDWGVNVRDIDPFLLGTNLRATEATLRYNRVQRLEKEGIFKLKQKEVSYYQMGVVSLTIHLTELATELGFINDEIGYAQKAFAEGQSKLEARKAEIEKRIVKNPVILF